MFKTLVKYVKNNFRHEKIDHSKLMNVCSASFDYIFMRDCDEKNYPKYLKEAYLKKMNQKLNLENPKTINEKIQWLKLYDQNPIKNRLTDKVLVRDWVKDKIGEKYLKPLLAIYDNFDEINFNTLPNCFIIKCNHGCKWNVGVKNKENFLNEKYLFKFVRMQISGWLRSSFFCFSDFETQYKNIIPKLMIEELLLEENGEECLSFEVWCFNSEPKMYGVSPNVLELESIDKILDSQNENLKEIINLSKILSEGFKFVRVDWMICNNKIYFEEMTFTPCSGFITFDNKRQNLYQELGKMLNLKGN